MCEDMNTLSMILGKDDDQENISVGTVGRKIAERILMELYCNTEGSDIFSVRPNPIIHPEYFASIGREIALNDVRDLLIRNENYKLSEVVEDIKQVLVNAMSYYEVGDPYFNSARRLLNHLHRMYQSWIA
ncbi:uncharacterized protein LOC111031892 [Myzus persicae]|uniref:uncharacterized protein LOC111031892 n=1 Tax=Myzus persicae TaxID=13164 RepID=UPI000B92F841|nr:uncharacterized protein LOC111031892 [Myzus persicae]